MIPLVVDLGIEDSSQIDGKLPSGTKDNPRVDFTSVEFDKFIFQRGVRLAWSRAAICSCASLNTQTRQPDPNCPVCRNRPGLAYFRSLDYTVPADEFAALDPLQQHLVERSESPAILCKGIVQSFTTNDKLANMIGIHREGSLMLTVPSEIVVGYDDRFTILDNIDMYKETIVYDGNADGLVKTRFPTIKIEYISVNGTRLGGSEAFVDTLGDIHFNSPPALNSVVSVAYLHRPQYIMVEALHTNRVTTNTTKLGAPPLTPSGNPQHLPRQYRLQQEFFV